MTFQSYSSLRSLHWLRENANDISVYLDLNDKYTKRIRQVGNRDTIIAQVFLRHECITSKTLFYTTITHDYALRRLIPELCEYFSFNPVVKQLFDVYDELCKEYFYHSNNPQIQTIRMMYNADRHIELVYQTLPNQNQRDLDVYFMNNSRILLRKFVEDYDHYVPLFNRLPRKIYFYLIDRFNEVFYSYRHLLSLCTPRLYTLQYLRDESILDWYDNIQQYLQLSGDSYLIPYAHEVEFLSKDLWLQRMKQREVVNSNFCEECPSDCTVCYESITPRDKLSCGHHIHETCVIRSKKTCCPMCRQEVYLSDEALGELYELIK